MKYDNNFNDKIKSYCKLSLVLKLSELVRRMPLCTFCQVNLNRYIHQTLGIAGSITRCINKRLPVQYCASGRFVVLPLLFVYYYSYYYYYVFFVVAVAVAVAVVDAVVVVVAVVLDFVLVLLLLLVVVGVVGVVVVVAAMVVAAAVVVPLVLVAVLVLVLAVVSFSFCEAFHRCLFVSQFVKLCTSFRHCSTIAMEGR